MASPEQCEFLAAREPSSLHEPLDSAEQRQQAQGDLDHADRGCIDRDDGVAGQGQLEAATERSAVYGGDRRDRYIFELVEQSDGIMRPVASSKAGHIGAGAKMTHVAAQQNGPATLGDRPLVGRREIAE